MHGLNMRNVYRFVFLIHNFIIMQSQRLLKTSVFKLIAAKSKNRIYTTTLMIKNIMRYIALILIVLSSIQPLSTWINLITLYFQLM